MREKRRTTGRQGRERRRRMGGIITVSVCGRKEGRERGREGEVDDYVVSHDIYY